MSTHTVHATITVEVTNAAVLGAIPGLPSIAGADERTQLEAAVNAGLRELKSLGGRYGFKVVEGSATVE